MDRPLFASARSPTRNISTLTLSGGGSSIAAKVMVVTTISGAFGSVTNSIIGKVDLGYWDSGAANNGLLAGLVGITGGCSTAEPEGAMVIGIVSAFVYTFSSKLMVKLQVSLVQRNYSSGQALRERQTKEMLRVLSPLLARLFCPAVSRIVSALSDEALPSANAVARV